MHQEQLCWHTIRGNKGKQNILPKEMMMKHLLPRDTRLHQKGKRPQPHGVTNGRGDRGLDRRVSRKLSDMDNIPLEDVRSCRKRSPKRAGSCTLTSQWGTERDQRAADRQTLHQFVLRKEHPPLARGQSIAQPDATVRTNLALSKPGTPSTWYLM